MKLMGKNEVEGHGFDHTNARRGWVRGPLATLLFGLTLVVGAQAVAAQPEAPVPIVPAGDVPAGDVSLPTDLEPLDPSASADLEPLIVATERFRGLERRRALTAGVQDAASARNTFDAQLAAELPPDQLAHGERALRMLGLWPQDLDLGSALLDVLSSQVAGYYDPHSEVLTLVAGDDGPQIPGMEGIGDAAAERLVSAVWVHEINHALQDQHFDLEALLGESDSLFSDRQMARRSLAEGDSTAVMSSYILGIPIERMPRAELMFSSAVAESSQGTVATSFEGLEDAPPYLRETLLFPYTEGLRFRVALAVAGGQKLIDHAFRDAPPESTEQILHPEKWLTKRDRPVRVSVPDLASLLAGRERVLEGDLGELGLRLLLEAHANPTSAPANHVGSPQDAAAGWGGDRLALYLDPRRPDETSVLAWVSEWDSAADADEMRGALEAALGNRARITGDDTRLAMVLGLDAEAAAPVLDALAEAPATRFPERVIDLAAIGITEQDVPRPIDPEALAAMFRDPAVLGIFEMSLGSEMVELFEVLADQPALLEAVVSLGLEAAAAGGDTDLTSLFASEEFIELLRGPAGQAFQQRMAERAVVLDVRLDGRTLSIDEGRLSLRLPAEGQWQKIEIPMPESTPAVARPGFQTRDAETGVALFVIAVRWPWPMPLEGLAAGARIALPVTPLRDGYADLNGIRYWEMEGTMPSNVQIINRLLLYDGKSMVSLMLFYPAGETAGPAAARAAALLETIQLRSADAAPLVTATISSEPSPSAQQPLQVEGEITAPRQLHAPPPAYPKKAKKAGIHGVVVVQAIVRKDGTVVNQVEVIQSPDARLTKAAIRAIRQWRFQPATLDGKPVDVYYNLTVNFRLK